MRVFQPITRCTTERCVTERDARSGDVGADVGVGKVGADVSASMGTAVGASAGVV